MGTCHILQGAQLSALMTQRGRMAGGQVMGETLDGGDVSIYTTDSLHYLAETNTALCNYTPIKISENATEKKNGITCQRTFLHTFFLDH